MAVNPPMGAQSAENAFSTEANHGNFGNWIAGNDPIAHNEAYFDWLRSENSAQTAREWDKMMSDTQFRRKVADVEAAGFSPLAALESSGNYAVSSAVGRSSAAHPRNNNFGGLLVGLFAAFASLAGTASKASTATAAALAKADTWKEVAQMRANSAMEVARYRENAWRERYGAFTKTEKYEPEHITPEELEKALRKAFPNG